MDAYDIIKWREIHFGFDRRSAAKALGISLNSLRNYEEGTSRIPPYVPILCNAVANKIDDWKLPAEMQRDKMKNPNIKPSTLPRGPIPGSKAAANAN